MITNNYQKQFQQNIIKIGNETGKNERDIFADNVEIIALAFANSTTLNKELFDKREKRYQEIISRYKKEYIDLFVNNMSLMADGSTEEVNDFLGAIYEGLDMHNKNKGQFFTPIHIADLMAKTSTSDIELETLANSDKVLTVSDPTCGAGNLFIGFIKRILSAPKEIQAKLQRNICFHGADLDPLCVNMAYSQISMLGYAGKFEWCNTLTNEHFDTYFTPAYFIFGTERKQRFYQHETTEIVKDLLTKQEEEIKEAKQIEFNF